MKPEIKQRIEQIRQGEVPDGYMKTKVGVIPADWNICTINDIATVSSGSTPNRKKEEYWNGNIPWVTTGELESGYVKQTKEAITVKALIETNLKTYLPGTLLLAMYGQGKTRGTVARLCINATINQACAGIVVQSGNSDYVYFVLQKAYENIRKLSNSGSQDNLNADIIKSYTIAYPLLHEQNKIATILSTQDKVIELYEKKIEQLQLLKKICLKKMFPKEGSFIPEVRFQGFTAPWEQSKLGDEVTEMIAGGDIDKNLIRKKGKYPVIANALTNDGIIGFYENEYRVKAPAVTITGRGDVGHAKARFIDFTPVVRLISLKSEHNVLFLENEINTVQIDIESTGVPQLTVPQLSQYKLFFPYTIQEEEKIGQCFQCLNHLITLHQQRRDEEKRKKKALMQLLLTGIVRV